MGALKIPEIGKAGSTEAPKVDENFEALNAILDSENKVKGSGVAAETLEGKNLKKETVKGEHLAKETIKRAELAAESKPFTWYKPLAIATEESRTNVAFGTLTTADEIKEVVLPENGLIAIGYIAVWKSSGAATARASIFLGSSQIKRTGATAPEGIETAGTGTNEFSQLTTAPGTGLTATTSGTSLVSTGQVLGNNITGAGGMCYVFAAAGTYNVSIQFKSASGSVTVKERKLWVGVSGV